MYANTLIVQFRPEFRLVVIMPREHPPVSSAGLGVVVLRGQSSRPLYPAIQILLRIGRRCFEPLEQEYCHLRVVGFQHILSST